ncbi:MAG TPA: 4-alpha-glucanotransferase [Solirubrobacteraceae bacterium]
MNQLPRSSGVQLHITSLPGGRLGPEAYRFLDWLKEAGQSWWQVLPLGPPDRWGSPYKARSAFAAWPGLLGAPRARVSKAELDQFRAREAYWIGDWERVAGAGAIEDQVRFDREWAALRRYAAERDIRLLGDVAIYVAPLSAEHRAHPELFQRGFVAGVPPDSFSETGQLWGNPVYDWSALRRDRYRWWVERLRRTLELVDVARLDHFRGFVSYWAVPAGSATALPGRWRRGPGRALFDEVSRQLGGLPFVAEDLGLITPAVRRLRDSLALPGMLVLQLGFEPRERASPHRLERHSERRFVYTGTHDNDTIRGWYESLDRPRLTLLRAALASRDIALDEQPWWGLIRLAFTSPARVAMVQAQDVLGLGSEARMNDPGRPRRRANWHWRLDPGSLTPALAARLREVTEEAGRLNA